MTTFTIMLTEQELQVIGKGLGELPAKIAIPVLNSINEQMKQQFEKNPSTAEGVTVPKT